MFVPFPAPILPGFTAGLWFVRLAGGSPAVDPTPKRTHMIPAVAPSWKGAKTRARISSMALGGAPQRDEEAAKAEADGPADTDIAVPQTSNR